MNTRALPFPAGPEDGDVFYHGELVCVFLGDLNTWECRRISPNPSGINVRGTADGQAMIWHHTAKVWEPGNQKLLNLDDVEAPTPVNDNLLIYSDATSTWVPITLADLKVKLDALP